jgi:hypothetical protein
MIGRRRGPSTPRRHDIRTEDRRLLLIAAWNHPKVILQVSDVSLASSSDSRIEAGGWPDAIAGCRSKICVDPGRADRRFHFI